MIKITMKKVGDQSYQNNNGKNIGERKFNLEFRKRMFLFNALLIRKIIK